MKTQRLLKSLLEARASANVELLDALAALPEDGPPADLSAALRVLDHAHRVDLIFAAHLEKRAHPFTASWSVDAPKLPQLAAEMRDADRWYLDCIAGLTSAELDEPIAFTFTDGARGTMSRAEMIAHVITHSAYHRGEVGRLLPQIEATAMRDVFAGYLHRAEPARRHQSISGGNGNA